MGRELFGSAGNRKQEEQVSRELPLKVWFVGRTSTMGGAVPSIVESRDGVPFKFKTGLACVGGDGKSVTDRMFGIHAFFNAFLRPNMKDQGGPSSQDDYDQLSGRLVGFMNACLSPGIEDKDARWQNTLGVLGNYAAKLAEDTDPERHLTANDFRVNGGEIIDNAAYMAFVFVNLLKDAPRLVIINQRLDKGKNGDRNDIVVGSYKDAIAGNANGLAMFTSADGESYDLYGAAETGAGEDLANF
jgi:hypothetical protein